MELASFHATGAYDIEVASRSLENLRTPGLLVDRISETVSSRVQTDLTAFRRSTDMILRTS